jgi:ATP-dependent Clp protease ATP-binding subunit ClpX
VTADLSPLALPGADWEAWVGTRVDDQLARARARVEDLKQGGRDAAGTLALWNDVSLALSNAFAVASLLSNVMPEDLLKFGLIPEFIGRLPVIATVDKLNREALVQILTEPRNALVKQYQKLFDLDGVELEFTDDAIEAVADLAMMRGTGARGLRAIIEEVLLHVMYDVPSREDIAKVVVNAEVVNDNVNPTLVPREPEAKKKKSA